MPSTEAEGASKRQKTSGAGPSGTQAAASNSRGTIARVKLHNFMSYRDAEIVDPGTRLNCIVGPNGTGKSSIVCAMCVGLGGPLSITARGDQIGTCVHGEGATKDDQGHLIKSGFVETELVDGNGAGRNLVVRLDFNCDNKKEWRMDGKKVPEKDVKHKMAELNIQVDNPLQFLPQDKVGEFSNMSPIDLLKKTELAIGPETHNKHMRLIEEDKEIGVVKQRLVTEEKELNDLEARNHALAQDVERFKALQENKKRLDTVRGKKAWAEAEYLQGEVDKAKKAMKEAKDALKECQARHEAKAKEAEPLDKMQKEYENKLKEVTRKLAACEAEREAANAPIEEIEREEDKLQSEMTNLSRKADKFAQKTRELRTNYESELSKLEAYEERLSQGASSDPAKQKQELEKRVQQAKDAEKPANEAVREHAGLEDALRRRKQEAQAALNKMSDATARKQEFIRVKAPGAANCARWIESRESNLRPEEDVIGPLLLYIDIPDKDHQLLAEECLSVKHSLNTFLARTKQARNILTQKTSQQNNNESWRVNVTYCEASAFVPTKRPSSSSLSQFGITAWLDEAVSIPSQHRDAMLGALKDLVSIDRFLLGTSKTEEVIEQLQSHLSSEGMDMVTILTPGRVYRVTRSRYGERRLNAQTQMPKPKTKAFLSSVDPAALAGVQREASESNRLYDEWQNEKERLDEKFTQCKEAKQAAFEALAAFNKGAAGYEDLKRRVATTKQRYEKAAADEAAFDPDAQKVVLEGKLVEAAKRMGQLFADVAKASAKLGACREDECACKLAIAAAKWQLQESKGALLELERETEERKKEKLEHEKKTRDLIDEAVAKAHEAKSIAPGLERDKKTGQRTAQAQGQWDSLPNDLDELDSEVVRLEEEINASDDGDGGNTLKEYEERLKQIETSKKKVDDTRSDLEDKVSVLEQLKSEWQPELTRLVSVVNDNFSSYFARFKCCGEVSLADGRKINPQTGQPEGEDNFAEYKILIKVQWRSTEALHVLGEGGRDSGGERSVATMVYLISLQNINPAPFRVVDEINQAMDSHNERSVFECITHACREGGKQYFLLTPKLLPDLEYGEDTCMQIVLNGPYVPPHEKFHLGMYV